MIYAELKTPAAAKNDGDTTNDRAQDEDDASLHSHRHNTERQQQSNRGYAMKIIPKSEILRHNQLQAVMTEKHILTDTLSTTSSDNNPHHPLTGSELFMKLFMCFHDASSLYFVLELCSGGTLYDLIQSRRINNCATDGTTKSPSLMDISLVKYYTAQIVRALEYLHQRGVVHRDVSPRNIGLTFRGEIKLGDFGSAVVFVKDHCEGGTNVLKRWTPGVPSNANTETAASDFVGTADYVSPEMLRGSNNECTNQSDDYMMYPALDLWSVGCIMYHMLIGTSPFHAESDHLAFEAVLDYANGKRELVFPPLVIDESASEMISMLLSIDPASRLGMQDGVLGCMANEQKLYQSIRNHLFFQQDKDNDTFWALLESKSIEPPYKPPQPNWMADLHRGIATLKTLRSIEFDL